LTRRQPERGRPPRPVGTASRPLFGRGRSFVAGHPKRSSHLDTSTDPPEGRPPQRRRPKWWLLGLLSVLAVITGAVAAHLAAPNQGSVGGLLQTETSLGFIRSDGPAAADWALVDLRTGTGQVGLRQFAGRPVVLNFWASWCVPCRKEMPALGHEARAETGRVVFVGVDTNDSRSPALALAHQTGVGYPLAFDPTANVARIYGVFGLPTTVFISPRGRIVGRNIGALTTARLSQLLAELFPAP